MKKKTPQESAKNLTGRSLTPLSLLAALNKVSGRRSITSYQTFRGIYNQDYQNKPANYCYAISFLQLLYHSNYVKEYFNTENILNKNEKTLLNFFNDMSSPNNNIAIKLDDFIRNYRGWKGRYKIPNNQCDIQEFGQYFLNSVSKKMSNLFFHNIKNDDDIAFQVDEHFERTYFLQCPITNNTIQNIINDKLTTCNKVTVYPKCLFILLLRQDTDKFNNQCVSINSMIKVYQHIYKFVGTACSHVVTDEEIVLENKQIYQLRCQILESKNQNQAQGQTQGQLENNEDQLDALQFKNPNSGHYTDIIKIENQFFLFDDQRVSPLFYYDKCPSDTIFNIREANIAFKEECTLLLYEECSGPDFNGSIEEIKIPMIQPNTIQNQFQVTIDKNPTTSLENSNCKMQNKTPEQISQEQSCNYKQANYDSYFAEDFSDPEIPTYLFLESKISSNSIESENQSKSILETNNSTGITECLSEPRKKLESNNVGKRRKFLPISKTDKIESYSEPRSKLDASHSWSFYPELLNNDFSKIGSFEHKGLKRVTVNVDKLNSTVLHGKMNININNIPSIQKMRTENSKFIKYRNIFKIVARVLRNLDYNDQGELNANITKNALGIESEDDAFAKEQGEILYDIINEIADENNFDVDFIEGKLQPIIEAYKDVYYNVIENDINDDIVINDDLKNAYIDVATPRKTPLTSDDLQLFFENLHSNLLLQQLEDKEIDDDDFILDSDYDDNEIEEEEEEEAFDINEYEIEEEFNTNMRIENVNENENDYNKPSRIKSNAGIDSLCNTRGIGYYLLGTLDWILDPTMYPCENAEEVFVDCCWDNDDNQFTLGNYNWRERVHFDDAEKIINKIQEDVLMRESEINSRKEKGGIEQDKNQFYRDFIRYYCSCDVPKRKRKKFCIDFIEEMRDKTKTWEIIIKIKNKRKMRAKQTNEEEEEDNNDICTPSNLLRKIRRFEKLDENDKKKFLIYGQKSTNHGGARKELQKVTKDTIKCLIVLILDFPTLSADSIAKYINSRYGPNYNYALKISKRTVQRYLKLLRFSVKKAQFAPPNRNSIGLRIYRVAWCKIIEDILENDNVLIAFVDEASVTSCEGRAYGRAYAGITPVINVPLSKVQMTIVAMVIPCYGVLYTFIDNSCKGTQYAQFLKDAIAFIRKYICNKNTEIVVIEDNCPIHSTDEVENTVLELKFALLPIVPYSPCLNEVVEGYFGLMKTNNIMTCGNVGEIATKGAIQANWMFNTNSKFDETTTITLLTEWKARMEICKKGQPIYSAHVPTPALNTNELLKNLYVTVDRTFDNLLK